MKKKDYKSKEGILDLIKNKGFDCYYFLNEDLKNDKDIALAIVKQNGMDLEYSSERLRNDKEVVLEAVKQNGWALKHASKKLQNDKELILEMIESNPWGLEFASDTLKNNKEVILKAIRKDIRVLKYASEELKNDKFFILKLVKENGNILDYVCKIFQNDKEVVLEAINQNGIALLYASDKLKADKEVVLKAMKNGGCLGNANFVLREDKEVVLEAMKQDWKDALFYVNEEMKILFNSNKCFFEKESSILLELKDWKLLNKENIIEKYKEKITNDVFIMEKLALIDEKTSVEEKIRIRKNIDDIEKELYIEYVDLYFKKLAQERLSQINFK